MKKTFYITLLATLLMQWGGLFLILKLQQCSIWYEMMEELMENQSGFTKLVLTAEEYETGKINDHELLFRGQMYDFKSAVIAGNEVELLALVDYREQEVIEKMNRLATNTSDSKSPLSLMFLKIFSTSFILPDTNQSICNRYQTVCNFIPLEEHWPSNFLKIVSPPPKEI